MDLDQFSRIDKYLHREPAPPVRITISFTASAPGPVLERVRSVMRQVAVGQVASWPSDDQWLRQIPRWFARSFEGHNLEEMLANPNLWDFGSWLDAMKHPGWEWWSSGVSGNQGVVDCTAHAMPFAIEPLLYLLRAAGATEIELAPN